MDTVDARAAAVARDQRGRATRRQLLEDASISSSTIMRRLASGAWTMPLPNVIDLGTHRATWHAHLHSLLLATGPDSCLSHLTAAYLHGFLDVARPPRPDVLVRRGAATTAGRLQLHTTERIEPDEVTVVRNLRVTTPGRTLLDLASRTTVDRLEQHALQLARTDRRAIVQLGALFDRYRRTPGRRRLAEAVSRLPADAARLGSPLEVLAVQELRRHEAPRPVLQYQVCDHAGAPVKRTDAAWPDLFELLEVDGAAYHDTSTARREDAECRDRLRDLGWRVNVLRREDLNGPRVRELAQRLRAAQADLGARS